MEKKLLVIGGASQVLFGLFHLLLSKQIQSLQGVSFDVRATMRAEDPKGQGFLYWSL